jgi:hypothetical protein
MKKKNSFWVTIASRLKQSNEDAVKRSVKYYLFKKHSDDDSDSANQFDEDVTENSSFFDEEVLLLNFLS